MIVPFPSYQVLLLTANSSLLKDPFDLVDGFLYFGVDVLNICL